MAIRHVELTDFRIFHAAHLQPEADGTTVITGANGTGKTSVLEALAYLATRRSFRGAPTESMVRTGASSAFVRAELERDGSPTLVEAEVAPAGRSRTRVNRKAVYPVLRLKGGFVNPRVITPRPRVHGLRSRARRSDERWAMDLTTFLVVRTAGVI